MPYDDATFDAAFENNVLLHMAGQAVPAAAEIRRVSCTGGFLVSRDADASAVSGVT